MIIAHAQFTSRAVHTHRRNAAQLGLLNLEVSWQHRTNHGYYHVVAFVKVLSTTHNLQWLWISIFINILLTHVNTRYPHVIRVRVLFLRNNLARNHLVISST